VRVSPGIADVYMESKYGGAMTLVMELRDAPSSLGAEVATASTR